MKKEIRNIMNKTMAIINAEHQKITEDYQIAGLINVIASTQKITLDPASMTEMVKIIKRRCK